jgi:tRNA(Arg) A34 adenosine deaminase TadA
MPSHPDPQFMRLAIAKATEGLQQGQQPFGACLVQSDQVIACLYNTVWASTDITAHPETQAVREACRQLRRLDLADCVLYATCEPCPMCFSAAYMAGITTIVYGVRLADTQQYGFGKFPVPNTTMNALVTHRIEIIGDFLRSENIALLRLWSERQMHLTEEGHA